MIRYCFNIFYKCLENNLQETVSKLNRKQYQKNYYYKNKNKILKMQKPEKGTIQYDHFLNIRRRYYKENRKRILNKEKIYRKKKNLIKSLKKINEEISFLENELQHLINQIQDFKIITSVDKNIPQILHQINFILKSTLDIFQEPDIKVSMLNEQQTIKDSIINKQNILEKLKKNIKTMKDKYVEIENIQNERKTTDAIEKLMENENIDIFNM